MAEQLTSNSGNSIHETPALYEITSTQIRNLRVFYTFNDYTEVSSFIEANSFLEPLLAEAVNPIKAVFNNSSLSVKVFHDTEFLSGNHLVLGISTKLKAKEALKELDKLDEGWWQENIERAKGLLSIELNYQ